MMDSTAPSNQFFSSPQNRAYIKQLKQLMDNGYRVSLADVAYSNGADNGFMNELAKQAVGTADSYNGWNTADNTVGFAICQGILTPQMSKPDAEKLMRIRVIDDWYYQANARRSATAIFWKAKIKKMQFYLLGPYQKPVHDLALGVCRDLSGRYKFTEKSNFDISFPWNRLFEIDVELKKDKKK